MTNKNKINLSQLRQDQLSGYILVVSQEYVNPLIESATEELNDTIQDVSGQLRASIDALGSLGVYGLTFPLAQNVDTIHCYFGQEFNQVPKVTASLGSNGVTDPIIIPMMRERNATGCSVIFSAVTPSDDYYLDLIISV